MKYSHLSLKVLPESYSYVLFDGPSEMAAVLDLASTAPYLATFCFDGEYSVVVPDRLGIKGKSCQSGFSALRIVGEIPFGTVQGLIATVSACLQERGIGVCVVSSFQTDLFLVTGDNLAKATDALRAAGWKVGD